MVVVRRPKGDGRGNGRFVAVFGARIQFAVIGNVGLKAIDETRADAEVIELELWKSEKDGIAFIFKPNDFAD